MIRSGTQSTNRKRERKKIKKKVKMHNEQDNTFSVLNDAGLLALHDGNGRVGGTYENLVRRLFE